MEARWERGGKVATPTSRRAKSSERRKLDHDSEDEPAEAQPNKRTRRAPDREAQNMAGPKVNFVQKLKANKKKPLRRTAGAVLQFKKSKSPLQQDVNKNASQSRKKAVATSVFNSDSDEDDTPLIMKKRQQSKPAAPLFGSDSEGSDVAIIKTRRQRVVPAAPTFNSNSEDDDAPVIVTMRKRPAVPVVESDSDEDADFIPKAGKRRRQAASVIESDSDSDTDPIVVHPRKTRRMTKATIERGPPATPVVSDSMEDAQSHGINDDGDLEEQLRRVNKRMIDQLREYLEGDDTPLAKYRRVSQEPNTHPVGRNNASRRKTKQYRNPSQSRSLQGQRLQTSQEHLGNVFADQVAKIIASITPADLNPLQTAPTSERYYDQVAKAL